MLLIDSSFKWPAHLLSLRDLETFPVLEHVYGEPIPQADYAHWMVYKQVNRLTGDIRFLKNLNTCHSNFIYYVTDYLRSVLDHPVHPLRVHVLRTKGTILPHVDEGRKATINIGVLNSGTAKTKWSTLEKSDTLTSNVWATQPWDYVKDGSAYLIDTSKYHSVEAETSDTRTLVSVSFSETYDYILSKLHSNVNLCTTQNC